MDVYSPKYGNFIGFDPSPFFCIYVAWNKPFFRNPQKDRTWQNLQIMGWTIYIYIEMFLFSQQKMKYNDEYDGDIVVMYVT